MAAYASLQSLSKVIDLTLHQNQAYVHLCSKEQMISVHENVARLQELLEDLSGKSESSIDVLESRIRDVAYEMEDIIEDVIPSSIIEDDIPRSLCEKQLSPLAKIPTPVAITPSAFDICAREISMLLDKAMTVKGNTLQDNDASEARRPLTTSSSSSHQAPSSKLDLKKVPIELMDRIFGGRTNLEIIPTTGMGGIGKTTLARAVYQHPRTLPHFDICSWETVSHEFNVKEILRGLLPTEQQNTPDQKLIEFVHKRLIGRRFLIVLDDMWDEKAWDGVRNAFPNDNKGSRIILTTRLLDVAKSVGSSDHVHQMQLLNNDLSWGLLQNVVGGYKPWPEELEVLGRTISGNCRGLPLAVVSMAGLLKFNMTEEYWKRVTRDTKSETTANYDHLFEILGLSYTHLPPYLKPCFLYFSLFKEDSVIRTEELLRLWMAEGFLKSKGSKEMEEVAEEYLEELVARSLVLVKKKRTDGRRIKTCSIHDVLRDLSLRKANEEKFSRNLDSYQLRWDNAACDDLRRVSLGSIYSSDTGKHSSFTNVRSLLCDCIRHFDDELCRVNFKLMRVLSAVPIVKNPQLSLLYELTNLRYLHIDLASAGGKPLTVSKSISKLQNLETLIFSRRWRSGNRVYALVFPSEIWEMPRLRHLILVKRSKFPCPELSQINCAGLLQALQTLIWVINFDLNRSTAAKLSNLKKLKLHYDKYLANGQTLFRLDNLVHLHQLEDLTVASDLGMVVSDLSFPHKLKKLSLFLTEMPVEKMSLIGSLPNLEVLKLKQFAIEGKEWEPVEGEFVQLKYLKMESLWFLEEWRAESEHFPQLDTLIIKECRYLKEVPAGIGEIDTLQKLVLKGCRAAEESVKEIKAEQESLCNNLLQVIIS